MARSAPTRRDGTAIIYVAARRGGNFIYAIDVSDPDNPRVQVQALPEHAGHERPGPDLVDAEGDQSCAMARHREESCSSSVAVTTRPRTPDTAGTAGRGVYVVDALTGTVHQAIPHAGGRDEHDLDQHSVGRDDRQRRPGTRRASSTGRTSATWRATSGGWISTTPARQPTTPPAGSCTSSRASGARKFFYPPDVVLGATFHAVVIGSGDREKPLAATSSDRFYMIKDTKLGLDGTGQTTITTGGSRSSNTADSTSAKGWYYGLSHRRRKVVNAPLTIGGVVYFGTSKPITAGRLQG